MPQSNHIEFVPPVEPVDILFEGRCADANTIIVRLLNDDNRQVALTFDGSGSSRRAMGRIVANKTYRVGYQDNKLVFGEIVI
jgi:hypothetical protein